jgi:hypothetical protein
MGTLLERVPKPQLAQAVPGLRFVHETRDKRHIGEKPENIKWFWRAL